MKKGKFHLTLEQKNGLVGLTFIFPWIIGFLIFFTRPMIQSAIYSFNRVTFDAAGIKLTPVGLENYIYAFTIDPLLLRNLVTSMRNLAYIAPIIAIFSLFVAIILNQKFKGRFIARSIFFLPVIVSGIVVLLLKHGGMSTDVSGEETIYLFQSVGLYDILSQAGIHANIIHVFHQFISRIFDVSWKSGIQILMYLSALQTIPRSYYEASDIEGATPWESFWKITVPLISPMTLVCVIYTVIDSFTYIENPVMIMINDEFQKNLNIHYSAALAWIYFLVVFIVVGLVVKFISKFVFYNEE